MKHLLDTDSIIDYLKGIPSSVELVNELHEQGHTLCSCDVVLAEVYAGLRPQERPAVAVFLSSLQFLETSPAAAQQAGEWRYTYAREGTTLTTADCLVAAVAASHAAALVTGNVKDYPMQDLQVVPLPRVVIQHQGTTEEEAAA